MMFASTLLAWESVAFYDTKMQYLSRISGSNCCNSILVMLPLDEVSLVTSSSGYGLIIQYILKSPFNVPVKMAWGDRLRGLGLFWSTKGSTKGMDWP